MNFGFSVSGRVSGSSKFNSVNGTRTWYLPLPHYFSSVVVVPIYLLSSLSPNNNLKKKKKKTGISLCNYFSFFSLLNLSN